MRSFFFHSTDAGEENSTTQTQTLDVVTEVKSGNNTVQYTYDNKRRVKSVSLNGVDDYVTYTYSGEHTNAETVTATLAKGTDCEIVSKSIKNAHGNVTKSTCGDRTVQRHMKLRIGCCTEHFTKIRTSEITSFVTPVFPMLPAKNPKEYGRKNPKEAETDDEWVEWQADNLSGALLMPREQFLVAVRLIMKELGYTEPRLIAGQRDPQKHLVLERLATLFQVSLRSVKIRLRTLGIYVEPESIGNSI